MNVTKIKVNGTSYDIEDAAATQNIATLDTSLTSFMGTKGTANGLASLDSNILVPPTQLPMNTINSYVVRNNAANVLVTTNSPTIVIDPNGTYIGGKQSGMIASITFLTDITASATTDTMSIKWHNDDDALTLKVAKDGQIVNFAPTDLGSSTIKFVQTGVTLDVKYIENGGQSYWLIIGNPIVLSSSSAGYTIYADGYIEYAKIFSLNIDDSKFALAPNTTVEAHYTGILYITFNYNSTATIRNTISIYEDEISLLYTELSCYTPMTVLIRKGHTYDAYSQSTFGIALQHFIPLRESGY